MSKALKTEKSAGFLIFRRDGDLRFLILKSKDRLDIPKGQLNPGEEVLYMVAMGKRKITKV